MAKSPERTLIFGGPVLTQNDRRDIHEAVVLEGDTVLATGFLSDMSQLAGRAARKVNVDGATVMPGLIDSHPHFLHFGSFDVGCVKLYDVRNHTEIFERIKARTAITPSGQWILTTPVGEPHYFVRRSWRDLPEGRLPNRKELDAVAPEHPVLIQAYAPRVPNVCAMNSRALQMLGITRELPDQIEDVWIEKDADGEPTGIFSGTVTNYYNCSGFWVSRVLGPIFSGAPADMWYWGALAGLIAAAERGVTASYEGHAMDPAHLAAYQRVRDEGRMSMRVLATLEAAPSALDGGFGLTDERIRENFALAAKLSQTTDPLYRINGMTMCMDGPAWSGLFQMDEPYKDPYGRPTKGRAFFSEAICREAIEYSLQNSVRLNMVQAGPVSHRKFLEALQPFLADRDIRAREWVMQHNIFIDDETIRRYAEMNFHFTSTFSFAWGKGDMYAERMGEQVLKSLLPIGKMCASGANVGLGSDWGPAGPFEHMALTERLIFAGSGRKHDGPGFAITRQQALDCWTINNAKLMQWSEIGALKPGYKADLTIVDRNPLTCGFDDLPKTQVLRTVLGGKDVFDTKILPRIDEADLPPERVQPLKVARPHGGAGHACGPQCAH